MQLLLKRVVRTNIFAFCQKKAKVKEELFKNPNFDENFPDLAQYKKSSTIKPQLNQEYSFMESLEKYYATNKDKVSFEQIMEHNHKTFSEGFQSPRKPLKYLTDEEKLKVNLKIDAQLNQLEETGLSREEILGLKKVALALRGVPLSQDAFFQYLKNNHDARYVYLSPNEEYTVRKIIDLALRQDLGKDQFGAAGNQADNFLQLERTGEERDIYVNTNKDVRENVNELLKEDKIYHFTTKSKHQKRKENLRFNIEMQKILKEQQTTTILIGGIQNFWLNSQIKVTFLSDQQQKKVSREIIKARIMMLFPYVGYIQPFHKRSLTNLQEDVEDFTRKKVNLATGQLYCETALQRKARKIETLTLQDDYELSTGSIRPDEIDKKLLKAQMHADKLKKSQLIKQGIDPKSISEKRDETKIKNQIAILNRSMKFEVLKKEDTLKEELIKTSTEDDCKQQFQQFQDDIKAIPSESFVEAFICENSLNEKQLRQLKFSKEQKQHLTLNESLEFINSIRKKAGLSGISLN